MIILGKGAKAQGPKIKFQPETEPPAEGSPRNKGSSVMAAKKKKAKKKSK